MNSKTRLKLTIIAGLLLSAMALLAIAMHLETVGTTCIAGIMTILSAYIWAQTKRPTSYDAPQTTTRSTTSPCSPATGIQKDDLPE
jgi:hypothetical protein